MLNLGVLAKNTLIALCAFRRNSSCKFLSNRLRQRKLILVSKDAELMSENYI